jgi:homeobox protein cut-like
MSTLKSNINLTLETWQKFDLESVKKELDDKVIEIAQQLDEGDQSKKRLIEQTKEFRKNLNEEQRKFIGPILKSFQIEVDSSNKRSKLMEQVLLKLYKQLIDLPDPVVSLENTSKLQKKAERVQDLEIENKQLRDTLEEYNVEFAQVKNQEVTIKNLNNKIKELEEKMEQSVQTRLKEKEKELQKSYAEKEEQMQQTQFDLVKKLGDTEARNLSLQSQLTKLSTDMYDFKSKQDEQLNAKTCEIDLLLSDLDKMTERAVNAERLNEQYVKQIALNKETLMQIQPAEPQVELAANNYSTKAIELELLQKEKEISQLVEDIKKLQVKSNKAREFYETQRVQLEEKLVNRERTLEQLEYELRKKHDYDEIKKELNILKAIEFNIPQDDSLGIMVTNEVGAPATNEPLQNIQQKSLEVLFLEKNRYLQNENTQLKSKLTDLQTKYDENFKEKTILLTTNLEQKNLILMLEKDLLKLATNKSTNSNQSTESGSSNNAASEILMEDDAPTNDTTNTNSSLFNIVSNQRERFRQRIQELESENMGNKQQVMFLTNEIDRLRSDNVKLYEKIKFLQSAAGANKSSKNRMSSVSDDPYSNEDTNIVLNKYTTEYEKRLDPFAKFNYNEKQKRYANLKLHDKFTLNLGRFILSNKMARLIFCAYFFIIHILIFISSYHMAHHDKNVRDYSAQCAESYKDHMDKAHGMHDFTIPH